MPVANIRATTERPGGLDGPGGVVHDRLGNDVDPRVMRPLSHPAGLDFPEFDRIVAPLRARSAATQASYGFALIGVRTASAQELLDPEKRLGMTLPSRYKTFVMR